MVLRGAHMPEFLREEILPDILRATAASFPQRKAIVWGDTSLTYGELEASVLKAAAALAALGCGPGAIVGLWMPRGAHLLLAQAAISTGGAAWLPLDAEIPGERAAICLQSAAALGVVSTREWQHKLGPLPCPVWFVEDLLAESATRAEPRRAAPGDPAYVIYTSGSTGSPKGITITHANICHFLRSENAVLGIHSEDTVYQGFSAAFDMSFEEIWISYLVGACLWVAPGEVVTDPFAIEEVLEREGITVLHAVPTLAALLERLPSHLRLINLGGEACPQALAARLTGKTARVFNTYGPTETTVSASVTELLPGETVTIGRPLPNYGMLLIGEQGEPLPPGQTGEIAVFGPGVSPGYLNLPELTRTRFLPNPYARDAREERLYLTGDLGCITSGGEVLCLGRVDHQVKLRGFRIELEEISAALSRQPGIATATAVVREWMGAEEIVAYAVRRSGEAPESALREALRRELPSYMVPAHIEFLEEMPRLSSGKINLSALRNRPPQASATTPEGAGTYSSETERNPLLPAALQTALESIFPGRFFRPEEDFFEDLGGHSLLAARLVSLLRKAPGFEGASVQHVYRNRTLGRIGEALRTQFPASAPAVPHQPAPAARRFLCGLAQLLCLPFLTLLDLLQWLAPFFVYHSLTGTSSDSLLFAVFGSVLSYLGAVSLSFPLTVILRRLLVGRLKEGDYPLWGVTYFRWWLGNQLSNASAGHLISGTPWKALHLRMQGARVGKFTTINSLTVAVPELLEIGDHVCIGTFVNIENARVEAGRLHIGRVRLGDRSSVDSYAVLENDSELGADARLSGQSALAQGARVPAGQTWAGAPARHVETRSAEWPLAPTPRWWAILQAMTYHLLGAALVTVLFFIPTFPTFILIDWIDAHTLDIFDSTLPWWKALPFFFCMATPAAMVLVVLTALLAGGLRLLFKKQVPGRFPIASPVYRHKWLLSTLLDASLQTLHGLYASVYAATWMRLLGAKVGKDAEISTAEGVVPQLLELGEGSFIADGALLGDEEQRRGWMQLEGTRIGKRSFVGNGAYVPDGAVFPEDVLLGVQSSAPPNSSMRPGQTWMGAPPMLLPARETIEAFPASLTFTPSWRRRVLRGMIEAVRIVLPLAYTISAGYVLVYQIMDFSDDHDWSGTFLALLLGSLLYAGGSFLLVGALKWIFVGRYAPRRAPMWTPFVWLSEAVTVAYESIAVPPFLDHLRGTPFLPGLLRLLGAKIGKGVWLNTTDLTEFDCVEIGDYAELNAHSGPQTHLFEDRIMRIGRVRIGAGATLGARTTVLYDASVGEYTRLGPLTLVAKGEHLPPCTAWQGTPATPRQTPRPS